MPLWAKKPPKKNRGKGRARVEPGFGQPAAQVRPEPRSQPSPRKKASKQTASKRSGAKRRSKSRQGGTGGFSLGRLFRRTFYWGTFAAIWAFVAAAGVVLYYGLQLPNTHEWAVPERPPNIRIVSADGGLIGNRGGTGGLPIAIDQLPEHVPNAVIAIEDKRYRYHFGLDPIGFSRAMISNVMVGEAKRGGSSLTQQLAKNLFLTPERSLRRKVQELVLAFWLEAKYTKDEILEMYLNRVYFGSGAYGIDAASETYFGKPPEHMTVGEAATLAALLRSPNYYAPNRHPERARTRRNLVISEMDAQNLITVEEATAARQEPVGKSFGRESDTASYVADFVMDRLSNYLGNVTQDIVVRTSVDMRLQGFAEQSVQSMLDAHGADYNVEQAALVSVDGLGAVRALVGGRDYSKSQFNRAVQAKRQPGSAFKPFVYLTALERGLTPETVRADEPVQFGNWAPKNYSGKYYGPVTLRTALANSLNTIAAKLAVEVGPFNVNETAHRLGIDSELANNASIALGTSEVTLLELTGAFTPFANGGFLVLPYVIEQIHTLDGTVLYERGPYNLGKVIRPEQLAMMNNMLSEVVQNGTAKRADLGGRPAAGKTGTTQDFRDAWFIGYTANLTTGVWVGNDDYSPTKRASGGNLPTMVWSDFMVAAHTGVPVKGFPGPQYAPPQAPMAGQSSGGGLLSGMRFPFGNNQQVAQPASQTEPKRRNWFFNRN